MAAEKGRATRARIVAETGAMLNVRGYHGTTIDDILRAAGLTKGGFYRHFADKDEVARAAYRENLQRLANARAEAVCDAAPGLPRLRALVSYGVAVVRKPPVTGGCPILNLAVEADDTRPDHRSEARRAMDAWRAELVDAGAAALAAGDLKPAFDAAAFASFAISATEGAIAQTQLYRDAAHVRRAVTTLLAMLDAHAVPKKHSRRARRA